MNIAFQRNGGQREDGAQPLRFEDFGVAFQEQERWANYGCLQDPQKNWKWYLWKGQKMMCSIEPKSNCFMAHGTFLFDSVMRQKQEQNIKYVQPGSMEKKEKKEKKKKEISNPRRAIIFILFIYLFHGVNCLFI